MTHSWGMVKKNGENDVQSEDKHMNIDNPQTLKEQLLDQQTKLIADKEKIKREAMEHFANHRSDEADRLIHIIHKIDIDIARGTNQR